MTAAVVRVASRLLASKLDAVAAKWRGIREQFAFAEGWEREWSKGNGRWSAGAAHEVRGFDPNRFGDVDAMLADVDAFLRARAWDGDYDEPTHARDEMLAAVEAVRVRFAAPVAAITHIRPELLHFGDCVELALHTFEERDFDPPLVDEPVDALVTSHGGALFVATPTGHTRLALAIADAAMLAKIAKGIVQQKADVIGQHDTANGRTITRARLSYDSVQGARFAATRVDFSHYVTGDPLPTALHDLLSLVHELVRPTWTEGALSPSWEFLTKTFGVGR